MRATDGVTFSNIGTGDTAGFVLDGGLYALVANAGTWDSGSVVLDILGPDKSTYIATSASLGANGIVTVELPPGEFQLAVTTTTGVYAQVTRVPGE